jgi:serine protease AprX
MTTTTRSLGRPSLGKAGRLTAATTLCALIPALSTVGTASPAAAAPLERVIVAGSPGTSAIVAAAVVRLGGHVESALPVVDGVTAELPHDAVPTLRAVPGVRSVTPDARGRLEGLDPTLGYDVGADDGSLYNIGQITHAKDVWNKGWTGKGVDVALIDSGVVPVQGLTSGNVVQAPDLSFESQNAALVHKDTFGHGTHMASIIAGRDVAATGATYAKSDSHSFNGVAPDARLVSLKVAAADGGSDVSQVIAAIDWVTQHAHDPGMNIRVLNLSYGTDSVQDPSVDPLAYAVENAWRAGIVVVVSSGNDGTSRTQLADPAIDPLVIAVGADDPNGTDSVGDDTVPTFAQRGTAARHVDVIAPGVHVLGLRDPNSNIDQANPGGRAGSRFLRGSGTSQAAAVVSGLAALYLQKYPAATPDQVKRALMTNATAPNLVKSVFAGLGVPDINKAIGAPLPSLTTSAQPATGATGDGILEGARGSGHVFNGTSILTGEEDIFGQPWDGDAWAASSAARTSWNGGIWRGVDWTNSGWSAAGSWDAHSWTASDWDAQSWTAHSWTAHSWTSSGWDASSWRDSSWDSSSWSASSWSASSWSASSWSGSSWSAASWR